MIKLININPDYGSGSIDFTVDRTDITVDSTLYTADMTKIAGDNSYYEMIVPYRFFSSYVKFYMINSLTNKEYNVDINVANNLDGTLRIRLVHDFKEGDNFEATIREESTNRLMWRGRIFSTLQVNLQDYNPDINPLFDRETPWEVVSGIGIYNLTTPCRKISSLVCVYMVNELDGRKIKFFLIPIDNENGTMTLTLPWEFKNEDSYEIKIEDRYTEELIYRGRLYITDQIDLQNFEVNPKVNGVVKI